MTDRYPKLVKMIGKFLKADVPLPEKGLGGGDTVEDKVIKAIKRCAEYFIQIAVLDEAAAMDGTRPLENLADCSGIAWGGSSYQMNEDLTTFKVLMTAGKGLTPAQQAWPPLTLEAYAQLSIKRAQVATLGSMRSINWTDHANVTKQQVLENIDVKHLRWISEIISDGSVIQSLSGRSALLGDGYSRNPSDRDELIAQRTKDLEGIIGQARAFDLDEFLSDWEPSDARPIPWTLPSDSGPSAMVNLGRWYWAHHPASVFSSSVKVKGLTDEEGILADSSAEGTTSRDPQEVWTLPRLMMAAGLAPRITVLYLPDYVTPSVRLAKSSQMQQVLNHMLPGYDISVPLAAGPFEDDQGNPAWFTKGKGAQTPAKMILDLKKDNKKRM